MTNKPIRCLIFILSVIVVTSRAQCDSNKVLKLGIDVLPNVIRLGEPFFINYSLQNVSTSAVYVLTLSDYYKYQFHNVKSAYGASPPTALYHAVGIGEGHFKLLEPDETYSLEWEMPFVIQRSENGLFELWYQGFKNIILLNSTFFITGYFEGTSKPIELYYGIDEWNIKTNIPMYNFSLIDSGALSFTYNEQENIFYVAKDKGDGLN